MDELEVDAWKTNCLDGKDEVTVEEIQVREALDRDSNDSRSEDGEDGALTSYDVKKEYTIVHGKCPVCLKSLDQGVLVKDCLHEFCFACISAWARHLALHRAPVKCPICRLPFQYVLANLKSATDYDVVDVLDGSTQASSEERKRRMTYRRRQEPVIPETTTMWGPVWKTNDQAKEWIDRELHVLLGDDTDTTLLLQIVFKFLDQARQFNTATHETKRQKTSHPYESLREALDGFLFEDSALFVRELSKFMASRLNMVTYDKVDDTV
ncbi:hypothetical protein AC1031_004960 [Aphanomyces cochlioides]|nr:hypothetical protein AC1031_004960 [Aphanomyces cochlioides]